MQRPLYRKSPRVEARCRSKASGRFKTARFDHGAPIANIDIRPMVFVTFLLPLILLFTAPIKTHALLVDLPQPNPILWGWEVSPPPYMTVEVISEGRVALDGVPMPIEDLTDAIRRKNFRWPIVLFRPDPDADYRSSLFALNAIVKAGVGRRDICFDRIWEHRQFGNGHVEPLRLYSVIAPDRSTEVVKVEDLPPSGCDQFNPGIPSVIY